MRRATWLRAAAVAGLLGVATACTVPTNEDPVELSGTVPPGLFSTTTTSTTSPQAVTEEAVVYFLATREGTTTLTPVERRLDVGAGVQDVLADLFAQPPRENEPAEARLSSAIPESATLLSATPAEADAERLIVDVRGLFGSIQGDLLRDALAQIVWTATEPGTGIDAVEFLRDGEPVQALIDDLESTEDPVVRRDYAMES